MKSERIHFYKYHGNGNDFIIIDNRTGIFNRKDNELARRLCSRHFGIGADGLILLQNKEGYDFEMVYLNSNGNESSMCGNGGRCITHFARKMNIIKEKTVFLAVDGQHEALFKDENIQLKMQDVSSIELKNDHCFMNTGSPHYLTFAKNISEMDIINEARKIRYNSRFVEKGCNVNFLEWKNGNIFMRTYERGVEDETLSCGTGIVAAALYASLKKIIKGTECKIITKGGVAKVMFRKHNDNTFTDIWLEGPAVFVYEGEAD